MRLVRISGIGTSVTCGQLNEIIPSTLPSGFVVELENEVKVSIGSENHWQVVRMAKSGKSMLYETMMRREVVAV